MCSLRSNIIPHAPYSDLPQRQEFPKCFMQKGLPRQVCNTSSKSPTQTPFNKKKMGIDSLRHSTQITASCSRKKTPMRITLSPLYSQKPCKPWPLGPCWLLQLVHAVAWKVDALLGVTRASASKATLLLWAVQCIPQGYGAFQLLPRGVGGTLLVGIVFVSKVAEVVDLGRIDKHADC